MRRTIPVLATALALFVTACASSQTVTDDPESSRAPEDGPTAVADQPVQAAVASYDLAVGEDRRFTAGLILADGGVLVGGEVSMELFYFGEDGAQEPEQLGKVATAQFLPVPGLAPSEPLEEPQAGDGSIVGVYETSFDFERPGRYGIGILADIDGERLQGTTTFDVAAEQQIVDVGQAAPTVPNPTIGGDAAPETIDSRAQDGAEVPDPQLHDTTLEESLAAGNRAVVLLSTPVYCVSRFCGPITEQVEQFADELPEDVDVIHIEVWEDFEEQQLHPSAAAWIQTETGGSEPWVFVVDDDGTVLGRWDNVVDLDAVRDLLEN
ncbi:MAG: hypothetical protein WEB03_06485 [Nitriliruptor sp.]|uniref:hypothetical protein n=1 Tax=Nitriliruptor sp. TaxID=2448056 RepID=UPI0034A006A5